MKEKQHLDEINSSNNHHPQHLLSLSASKISNLQKIDSHIKSTMPYINGNKDKKFIFVKIHQYFLESPDGYNKELKKLLVEEFEDKIQIKSFSETKQLLKDNYEVGQLHYLIVPEKQLSWAETFAREEREESGNKKTIFIYGVLNRSAYNQKMGIRSKQRIDKVADYVHYFHYDDEDYPNKIARMIEEHLDFRIREEENHVKTWALTNKYAEKKMKKRTIHFYYETKLSQELAELYKSFRKRSKSSWMQTYQYNTFEDILKSIRNRETAYNKEVDTAKKVYTSKLLKTGSEIDPMSMKSVFLDGNSQIIASSILNSSIKAINKLNQNDVNIIICSGSNSELAKFKALVRAQKHSNWLLWQIEEGSTNFFIKLRQFMEEEAKKNQQLEILELERIIQSKTLFILAESKDSNTIEMFKSQRNVYCNMQLLQYNDPEEFSVLLREGIKSGENFVIAVVPGGVNSFSAEYKNIIVEFEAGYKNGESVENYKFLSNANGRHVSNIQTSQIQLGTQSSMAYLEDNGYLENVMRDRDRHFHPLEGLKGSQVYLLCKDTKQHLLKDLKHYISESPRLQTSTYIDKEFLTKQIQTITLKDSAIVVTDDECLREAQQVLTKFDQVFILNITDRPKNKEEVKVLASGPKETIYDLIKQIPDNQDILDNENYSEVSDVVEYRRSHRLLPKKINFRPGDTIAIRIPAHLNDDESRKMEVRLKKYFHQEVKIQYYKNPVDVRLTNKLEEPITFIIWADHPTSTVELKEKRNQQLNYFKEMASNEIEELREEFIIHSNEPQKYQYLTIAPQYERFKFVSNRWEKIQEYIIGTSNKFIDPPDQNEWIYSDQIIHVFLNEKAEPNRNIINNVFKNRNQQQFNAANRIEFHSIESLPKVVVEEAKYHKYYLLVNTNCDSLTKQEALKMIDSPSCREKHVQLLLIQSKNKNSGEEKSKLICKMLSNESATWEWLSKIKVVPVNYESSIPHIIIDKSCLDWYYFLDKYSKLSKKFTFYFSQNKETLKKEIEHRKAVFPGQPIWIIVKDVRGLTQSLKTTDRIENGKSIRYILHGDEQQKGFQNEGRSKIIFGHPYHMEIKSFILNSFRREKTVFFPSSVRNPKIILAILDSAGQKIPLRKEELEKWEQILKAQIVYIKAPSIVLDLEKSFPTHIIYLVYTIQEDKAVLQAINNPAHNPNNFRKILLNPLYDHRRPLQKFVENNENIYIGTYPSEISEYLRFLRFNIRNPEENLQKMYQNQIVELYIQQRYKLLDHQIKYLQAKNDSIIVNYPAFRPEQINSLLQRASKYNYTSIFLGDNTIHQAFIDFSSKKQQPNIKFIDANASPLIYYNNLNSLESSALETNQKDEYATFLFNLPEQRYYKAKGYKGKFHVFHEKNNKNISDLTQKLHILQKSRQRNNQILYSEFTDPKQIQNTKEQIIILINGVQEKRYLETIKNNQNINYFILNDPSQQKSQDKSYTSYGNKLFQSRKNVQFQNFLNHLPFIGQNNLQPLTVKIDNAANLISKITAEKSMPLSQNKQKISTLPAFIPKQSQFGREQLAVVDFVKGTIDLNPPSLKNQQLQPSSALLPLGQDIIQNIKDHECRDPKMILKPKLDAAPSSSWVNFNFKASSTILPKPISFPQPTPILRLKLAILYPNTEQFLRIGRVLKENLEPDQFSITLISFKSEHELEEYSKNNGLKLNGFDKIVVFLSIAYRKYDANLKVMKAKLSNRMEYFIFDDNFNITNYQVLKRHLKPYRIRKSPIPYENDEVSSQLNLSRKIAILTPLSFFKSYEYLKSSFINVVVYSSAKDIIPHLHKEGQFTVVVCTKENYHSYKIYSKVSPRCMLLVETNQDLFQDELVFDRYPYYAMFYGQNGADYLTQKLPKFPCPHPDEIRYLYYQHPIDQDLVFAGEFGDYEKIPFKDYRQLYNLLMFSFKNCSNWLLRNAPVRPEIIPLHPKVYLENNHYMKDFKNNFSEKGYLNEEKIPRKSTLVLHEFSELPEIYYVDERELGKKLQKEDCPSVIIMNASNIKLMPLRAKYASKHKIISITDNSERWIDFDGNLPENLVDERLIRKQDMFTGMFNYKVFDQFNDMQYYYLSNKANVDHQRNIYFKTKEQLLAIFQEQQNLLMIIFVEAKDINHIPQALFHQGSQDQGRVKLILLKTEFVDDYDTFYIKFNEIDPVIRHINTVETAGRINFIVYNETDGERNRQILIQRRQLKQFENKPFTNMIQVEQIARNIKGRYKKVFIICFPDQKAEIENIMNSYSIKNKGILSEGVEYILIDRVSTIKPNLSHLSNLRPSSNEKSHKDVYAYREATTIYHSIPQQATNGEGAHHKLSQNNNGITFSSKVKFSDEEEKHDRYETVDHAADVKSQTMIRSSLKMENLLENKNFVLTINQKLRDIFPVGNFFATKVNYFSDIDEIAKPEHGVAQLLISHEEFDKLQELAEESPETVIVYVSNEVKPHRASNNMLIIKKEEIPNLIKRLEGTGNDEDLNFKNIEEYSKVRVVYDKNIDIDQKRKLLSASDKNKNIVPTIYTNVQRLKEYIKEPDSLLLLMMSFDPKNLEKEMAQENYVVVKKKKMKMILPQKDDSDDIQGLETIMEEEEVEQQNDRINKLTNEQLDLFLKIFETATHRPNLREKENEQEKEENEGGDLDNITKLNVHSNIRPESIIQNMNLFREEEIQKIKQKLSGDLIVLIVHHSKKNIIDETISSKYNVLIQSYTNSMNFENYIRDKKDYVTIALVDKNMLENIVPIKSKYPHVTFILENDTPQEELIEYYKNVLSGQIRKSTDLEKIIAEIYHENQRIKYSAESMRAASRFDMKRTSIVDVSNNQKLSMGLNNQRNKKVFLFYKEPENSHVKQRLSSFHTNSYIPYKNIAELKKRLGEYNNYTSILIANGDEIAEIEDYVSKKKEMIYIIRFNPPTGLRENHKVKRLFVTSNKEDLENYLSQEFEKYDITLSYDRSLDSKFKSNKNVEGKRYIQKYEPNTFGTTPRFPSDFVPPKSKESTYSRKYMKSTSRSKMLRHDEMISSPKSKVRNNDYFQT